MKKKNLFLAVLESGEFNTKVPADLVSGGVGSLLPQRHLVPESSAGSEYCVLKWQKGWKAMNPLPHALL